MKAVFVILGAALLACGTLSDTNGGGENLPNRGIVPLNKAEAPEGDEESDLPFVWRDEEGDLLEPSAVALVDGNIAVYAESRVETASSILRATTADGLSFGEPSLVLAAEQPWEEGRVGAPAVILENGTFHMWYRGGDLVPSIGWARSADGLSFTREAEPVVTAEAGETLGAPAVARLDDRLVMLVPVAREAAEDEPTTSIVRFDSVDGLTWSRRGVVLAPGTGCVNDEGEEARCWDAIYVQSPGIRVSRSPAGRVWFDLWFAGGTGSNSNVGFAGSYDGETFSRYRLNPILDGSGPESGPSVVLVAGGHNVYYSDRRDDRFGIAVALHRPE